MPDPTTATTAAAIPIPVGPAKPATFRQPVIPPYCWNPPETPQLTPWPGILVAGGPTRHGPYPDANLPDCKMINGTDFESHPGQDHSDPNDPNSRLTRNPHPLSDFSHVDPQGAPGSPPNVNRPDFLALRRAFNAGNPGGPQRLAELDYLQVLNRAVGPDSDSFQRLKRCFDVLVCRAHTLLFDINEAVKGNPKVPYAGARDAYRAFVANVDDREPHLRSDGIDLTKRFGYGKNIQWVFIDPVIEEVDVPELNKRMVLITNARIIIKWNPHSSSSGVPIPH